MGTRQEAPAEHLTSRQLAERLRNPLPAGLVTSRKRSLRRAGALAEPVTSRKRNPLLVEAPAALGTSKIKEMLIKAARSFYRAALCRIGRRKAVSSQGECFSCYGQLRAMIKETPIKAARLR